MIVAKKVFPKSLWRLAASVAATSLLMFEEALHLALWEYGTDSTNNFLGLVDGFKEAVGLDFWPLALPITLFAFAFAFGRAVKRGDPRVVGEDGM